MAKVARGGAVQVDGLRELQSGLRAIDRGLPRELRKELKTVAEVVAERARANAQALGGVAAKAAPSIRAGAEQRAAKVMWGGAKHPYAGGAFMGAIQYPQFQPWVGNTWRFGAPGEGPYAINDAINETEDQVIDGLGDVLERFAGRHLGGKFPGA